MANSTAGNIPRMNLTVAASGVFQFKVEGYSFTREEVSDDRQFYQSDTFCVGGYDWAVRYYPSKGGPGKYKVGLMILSNANKGPRVRFTLTLLSKSGAPSNEMKAVAAANVGFYSGARQVLSLVVPHASLADFLVEDSFVLHCTVSVLNKPKSGF